MHKNLFFRGLLALICIAAIWYSVSFTYRYIRYSRLTMKTTLSTIEWKVAEKASDQFHLEATYRFTVQEKSYKGHTAFPSDFYRNRWAAESDIGNVKKHYQAVWYDPANPYHSSLQKSFPLKECVSAAALWGLFLYFLFLGFYVAKFKN